MDQVLEAKPETNLAEFEPRTVVLKLDYDAARLFDDLQQSTGQEASELVSWALGAYWREREGVPLQPFVPMTDEELDQMIRDSEEDIKAGRIVGQDEMFERLRKKYGG